MFNGLIKLFETSVKFFVFAVIATMLTAAYLVSAIANMLQLDPFSTIAILVIGFVLIRRVLIYVRLCIDGEEQTVKELTNENSSGTNTRVRRSNESGGEMGGDSFPVSELERWERIAEIQNALDKCTCSGCGQLQQQRRPCDGE